MAKYVAKAEKDLQVSEIVDQVINDVKQSRALSAARGKRDVSKS